LAEAKRQREKAGRNTRENEESPADLSSPKSAKKATDRAPAGNADNPKRRSHPGSYATRENAHIDPPTPRFRQLDGTRFCAGMKIIRPALPPRVTRTGDDAGFPATRDIVATDPLSCRP
jgi:hypothetical protein